MMRTEERPAVAVRIDWPGWDGKCGEVHSAIERLNLSPLHSIAGEEFSRRFSVLVDAVERLFQHEEALLKHWAIPVEFRRLQLAEQQRIGRMLDAVRTDSLARKNQTAIEVYEAIRCAFDWHVQNCRFAARRNPPLPAQRYARRSLSLESAPIQRAA